MVVVALLYSMPLRTLWPAVVAEAKAALAANELVDMSKKQAAALLELLNALTADPPLPHAEVSKLVDSCGVSLSDRCKEFEMLAHDDAAAQPVAKDLQEHLKLLQEYVRGVGNCTMEMEAMVRFLEMCWPAGSGLKLPGEPVTYSPSSECPPGCLLRLNTLRGLAI